MCSHLLLRFGPPFLMREDRSISWDQLQQSILSKLYYLMINGAQAQVQHWKTIADTQLMAQRLSNPNL